jgi:Rrf2 family nitric oxide-sensitive transcriptional repressor
VRLTIYTDYALRVLIYLAANREKVCSIKDIATSYDISRHHLLKVANELAAGGFIQTIRGNGGGVRLAKSPHLISVGDVVRLTETDMHLVGCFDPAGQGCLIESACILQSALHKALSEFLRALDNYTIADLMVTRQSLQDLFVIKFHRPEDLKVA